MASIDDDGHVPVRHGWPFVGKHLIAHASQSEVRRGLRRGNCVLHLASPSKTFGRSVIFVTCDWTDMLFSCLFLMQILCDVGVSFWILCQLTLLRKKESRQQEMKGWPTNMPSMLDIFVFEERFLKSFCTSICPQHVFQYKSQNLTSLLSTMSFERVVKEQKESRRHEHKEHW